MAFSLTKKVALLSSIRHILSSRQHDLIFLRASPSAPAPVSERQLPGSQARLGRHPQGCRAGRASAHPLSVEGETNNDAARIAAEPRAYCAFARCLGSCVKPRNPFENPFLKEGFHEEIP